jgi:amidohydrolase
VIKTNIQSRSAEILDEIIEIRQHLHQYPELSFEEYETSKYVQSKLTDWEIDFKHGVAGTGIVGIIAPNKETTKCIALRADLDALPILEENDVPYKSLNKGVMHACGHDVHTSILLGALKLINENKDKLDVTVKFIFQPGEEKLPGGASLMIKENVLENPTVDEIYALHVFPDLEVGKVGLRSGMYMASCDEIYMTIEGKGGHGAMPHKNVDPILTSAQILTSLQQVVSRNCPPTIPTVLSFGRIEGLGATNVIPNHVKIEGTYRTMNESWREKAHHLIKKQATFIAKGNGATAHVNIVKGYPYLENNPVLTETSRKKLQEHFGYDNVINLPIRMTGEDFAFYAQKVPATFIRIGVKNESKGIIHAVHNSKFDIDNKGLKIGIETLLTLIFV